MELRVPYGVFLRNLGTASDFGVQAWEQMSGPELRNGTSVCQNAQQCTHTDAMTFRPAGDLLCQRILCTVRIR